MEYIAGMTSNGRVTIPKAIRDQLGWQPADTFHVTLEDAEVKLEKISLPGDTTGGATDVDAGIKSIPDIRRLEP